MTQNQSKSWKDWQTDEETYEDELFEEPFEEEQIEKDEPFEEEPIEEEPTEEEPIEEEPTEEEPIEEEPTEEEPFEVEPIEEETLEEEPGEQSPFEEELIEEQPLEEKQIEEDPLEESVDNKTNTKHMDSSLAVSKKRKRVTWNVNPRSVTDSLAKSSVNPDPRVRPQCTMEASKGIDMTRLYVANLPQNFTTDQLIGLFVQFGSIERAKMVTEKTAGLNRNYGLVKFDDVAHVANAIKEMNGYSLKNVSKPLYHIWTVDFFKSDLICGVNINLKLKEFVTHCVGTFSSNS